MLRSDGVSLKVACGAAETVPYITVTNLARTLRELQERDILVVGNVLLRRMLCDQPLWQDIIKFIGTHEHGRKLYEGGIVVDVTHRPGMHQP